MDLKEFVSILEIKNQEIANLKEELEDAKKRCQTYQLKLDKYIENFKILIEDLENFNDEPIKWKY